MKKWFEAAGPLALRDVDELMDHEFPISPTIQSDDDAVSDGDSAARSRNNEAAACRLRDVVLFRNRNAIHDQDSNPGNVLNSNTFGVDGIDRT